MPELAVEVRLVVVALEMRAPARWQCGGARIPVLVAVLEAFDARKLLGRHAHTGYEAPLQRSRTHAVFACPFEDGLAAMRGAQCLDEVVDRGVVLQIVTQPAQEEAVENFYQSTGVAQIRNLVFEIEQRSEEHT